METLFASCAGCMLGLMTGDSLGTPLNGMESGPLRHRYPDQKALKEIVPGFYGAATEMSAAVAASLAEFPEFNGSDMARRLVQECTEIRGYGRGSLAAIERLRRGVAWWRAGRGPGGRTCFGNGGAVRSSPIGLLYADDMETLRWIAEETAGITHQHALGSEGAVLQALAVALACSSRGKAIRGKGFLLTLARECQVREFRSRLEKAAEMVDRQMDPSRVADRLGNGTTALGSVVSSVFCFARFPDRFELAVGHALLLAGNTAAMAAMTGAISGAYLGLESIPGRWRDALEQGAVSPDRLLELARALGRAHLALP